MRPPRARQRRLAGGLGEPIVTTKTLRRRFFALAGRLTRSARRLTLHLPRRWPGETQFSRALARLQAIPSLTAPSATDPPPDNRRSTQTRASPLRDGFLLHPLFQRQDRIASVDSGLGHWTPAEVLHGAMNATEEESKAREGPTERMYGCIVSLAGTAGISLNSTSILS